MILVSKLEFRGSEKLKQLHSWPKLTADKEDSHMKQILVSLSACNPVGNGS